MTSELKDLLARVQGALEPFAGFVKHAPPWVRDDMPLTAGSSLARRQVTAGEFRRAAKVLAEVQALISQGGEHE